MTAAATHPEHERPAWAPLTLLAFAVLVVFTNIGGIFWAKLLDWQPWTLLVFSSRNRYLVLSLGADVWEPAYWTIAPLRIGVAFVVTHLIGRAYGDVVLGWFTRYLGVTYEAIQQFNLLYDRAHWFAIPFFVGSNLLGALSGIRRTPLKRVLILVTIGIYLRLALIRVLALLFEDELERFVGWVQRYSWWAVGISLVLVVLVNARNLRRGGAV